MIMDPVEVPSLLDVVGKKLLVLQVKPCVIAKVTVIHVTGFNVPVGPVKLKIVVMALHSDSEFLLPQAPPSLFDPGDELTQRAPVSTPDADLPFDADQQTAPPRVLQQHI